MILWAGYHFVCISWTQKRTHMKRARVYADVTHSCQWFHFIPLMHQKEYSTSKVRRRRGHGCKQRIGAFRWTSGLNVTTYLWHPPEFKSGHGPLWQASHQWNIETAWEVWCKLFFSGVAVCCLTWWLSKYWALDHLLKFSPNPTSCMKKWCVTDGWTNGS